MFKHNVPSVLRVSGWAPDWDQNKVEMWGKVLEFEKKKKKKILKSKNLVDLGGSGQESRRRLSWLPAPTSPIWLHSVYA